MFVNRLIKKKLLFLSAFLVAVLFAKAQLTTYTATVGTITDWTVPCGVTSITVTIAGAEGGSGSTLAAGDGASFAQVITVTPGEVLGLAPGEQGVNSSGYAGGGGGGSFVWNTASTGTPLVIAGGGGGGGYETSGIDGGDPGEPASTTTSTNDNTSPPTDVGYGGQYFGTALGGGSPTNSTWAGGGGAGWLGDGSGGGTKQGLGGDDYADGLLGGAGGGGGTDGSDGGFGGGGGGGYNGGGGGGGYNGGGGGFGPNIDDGWGGSGAGSGYWNGSTFVNPPTVTGGGDVAVTNTHTGNGSIQIEWIPFTSASLSVIKTNISCFNENNGTATVNITSGGTAPFTYSWSPNVNTAATASSLSAGTYSITVTDNTGCSQTATATITQPAAIDINTSEISANCNESNGSATATVVSGGTGPYTYTWSPGGNTNATATGLGEGIYSIIITDNTGCSQTAAATVGNLSGETAILGPVTNVHCFNQADGDATINVTGGTAPYTYLWTSSGQTNVTATGLSAGTYTVSVTDATGCNSFVAVTITQPAALTAAIGILIPPACNGETGNATITPAGGTSPYTYTWTGDGGTSATATVTAGAYTVTVNDNNGCAATALVTITQPAILNAAIETPTPPMCNGENGSATATPTGGTMPYTYAWTGGGGTSATATVTAGTYTVTVSDNNGCMATAEATITQPAALAATTSYTAASCNLANGSATATVIGGTSPYTYLWNVGQTNTTANVSAGSYTVTVTDQNNCTTTAMVTVTQPSAVTTSISATTNVSCNGANTGSAVTVVSGGSAPYTYAWSSVGNTTATATGLSAGTYTINVTDAVGCISTTTAIITQPKAVTATIGTPTNVLCNTDNNGSASVIASGGTPSYIYSWTGSGGSNATATGLIAGTYTVTISDLNGCAATAAVTITQPTLLTAITGIPTPPMCNGETGSASVTPTGGTSPYTYAWTGGGGALATATVTAGTYTVTVNDNNGCTATAEVTITQPAALAATSSYTSASCNLANGSATVTVTGGTNPYTYLWNTGQSTATATEISAGTYTVAVTDNNNCTILSIVSVTQPSAVIAASLPTNISCNGANNGSALAVASGGTEPYTYFWNPGGYTTPTASGLSAGTYTLSISDNNGCISTATAIITEPPVLTADITAYNNVNCNGGNNGSATVTTGGGSPAYTYSWAPAGGNNAIGTGLTVGNYTVTVTDNNGCSQTAPVVITQPAKLVATASASQTICSGGAALIAVTASSGQPAYTYLWNNGATSDTTTVNGSSSPYICTITDACGNRVYDTVAIITAPAPTLTACCNTTITVGNDTTITVSGIGIIKYQWEDSTEVTCLNASCDSVKVAPTVTTTYTVIGIDTLGCQTESIVTIVVDIPCFNFTVPNVFTPTNAGILGLDNVFYIKTTDITAWSLSIYDRWGVEMFSSSNPYLYWNGNSMSGGPAPAGVYYYIITGTCQNNTYKKEGYLQLIR